MADKPKPKKPTNLAAAYLKQGLDPTPLLDALDAYLGAKD